MKILHQLIKHFWQRGALTKDQADYLVEHGFIRSYELSYYEPRIEPADHENTTAHDQPYQEIDWDYYPLDDEHAKLAAAPVKRKGGSRGVRVLDYTPKQLGTDVRKLLDERAGVMRALVKLARPRVASTSGEDAAAALRKLSASAFRQRLLEEVQAAPDLLAKIWDSVDPEPFHYMLLYQSQACGATARAFETFLIAKSNAEWRSSAWLLQVPEVQTVANLMGVRRQLIAAIAWMMDHHRAAFDRCVRRPLHPAQSWQGLGFGLVLVHNARAWRAQRKPTGYVLTREPVLHGWREAWTTALSIDAEQVMPYCVQVLGTLPLPRRGTQGKYQEFAPTGHELICPRAWKI